MAGESNSYWEEDGLRQGSALSPYFRVEDGLLQGSALSLYFRVEVGLHQGSVLSPYLFLLLIDVLTEDVRKDVPGSMMFAYDIVLCGDVETYMTE